MPRAAKLLPWTEVAGSNPRPKDMWPLCAGPLCDNISHQLSWLVLFLAGTNSHSPLCLSCSLWIKDDAAKWPAGAPVNASDPDGIASCKSCQLYIRQFSLVLVINSGWQWWNHRLLSLWFLCNVSKHCFDYIHFSGGGREVNIVVQWVNPPTKKRGSKRQRHAND